MAALKNKRPAQPLYRKSKKCKICRSPVVEDLTRDLLDGVGAPELVRRYSHKVSGGLCTTNIYSHKAHCDPRAAALRVYRAQVRKAEPTLDESERNTRALVEMEFDKSLELLTLADACYREYIGDIRRCNEIIAELDRDAAGVQAADLWRLRSRVLRVLERKNAALSALTGHVLTHFKTEKGVPDNTININVLALNMAGLADDVATVLSRSIPDTLTHTTGAELRRQIGTALMQCVEERIQKVVPRQALIELQESVDDASKD